jgi:hypothetical protein
MIVFQYIILIASILFLGAYFVIDRKHWREIVLAALISAIWVSIAGIYNYKDTNIVIFGFNLYPFFAWTVGLVILKAAYEKLGKLKHLKATVLYIVLLLLLEFIGYNYMGIQLNSNYPGLFGLPLMHAPWYSQVYYLTIGPIYLLLMILLDKNNSNKK